MLYAKYDSVKTYIIAGKLKAIGKTEMASWKLFQS